MKKINLYGGAILFIIFLYSGYLLHHVAISHAADSAFRLGKRASHIYLLLIVLLNLLAYRVDFYGRFKLLEPVARTLLLLSGLCAAAGFFMQTSADASTHNVLSPVAVVLAFFSIALVLLDTLCAKK